MRLRMMEHGLVILAVALLGGCTTQHTQEVIDSASGTETFECPGSYQATCRTLLHAMQQEFGEHMIGYELWTDIPEASVFYHRVKSGGVVFLIRITGKADGGSRIQFHGPGKYLRDKALRKAKEVLSLEATPKDAV